MLRASRTLFVDAHRQLAVKVSAPAFRWTGWVRTTPPPIAPPSPSAGRRATSATGYTLAPSKALVSERSVSASRANFDALNCAVAVRRPHLICAREQRHSLHGLPVAPH